jgi:hypothetical protein
MSLVVDTFPEAGSRWHLQNGCFAIQASVPCGDRPGKCFSAKATATSFDKTAATASHALLTEINLPAAIPRWVADCLDVRREIGNA